MCSQINMVKYNADQEITNTYENLQIVQSQFFTDKLLFISIWSNSTWSIGLSVFRFVANKYKWIAIWLHLTIRNIRSAIRWAIMKVILNYLPLPNSGYTCLGSLVLCKTIINNPISYRIPQGSRVHFSHCHCREHFCQ